MIAVFIIILAIVLLIFTFQNLDPVSLSFLVWDLNSSLGLLIVATMLTGIIVGLLIQYNATQKVKKELKESKKTILRLEKEKTISKDKPTVDPEFNINPLV